MKLLLDTHAVIWFITDDKQLPGSLKKLVQDQENECFISIASFWEMGIKYALGINEVVECRESKVSGSEVRGQRSVVSGQKNNSQFTIQHSQFL